MTVINRCSPWHVARAWHGNGGNFSGCVLVVLVLIAFSWCERASPFLWVHSLAVHPAHGTQPPGSPVGSTLLDMSLPDWITAITGVGSAAGTVGAFAVSHRLLHRESRRDAERDKRLRREDASYVNAWVERDPDLDPHSDVFPPTELRFVVRNDGHTPVYNVTLLVPDFWEPDGCLVQTNFDAACSCPGKCTPSPHQHR